MAFIYDLADTWNNAAVTFTGIKLNVTDSASAASSLLMDLQVGGVSQFRVSKAGTATLAGGVTFGDGSSIANTSIGLIQNRITVASTSTYAFSSTAGAFGTPDIILARDAANTLAQRNGVNPQAFNLYNTFTDASNYERGFMRYVSNRLEIGHEALGTGNNSRTIALRTAGFDALSLTASTATFNVNVAIGIGSISSVANITNQSGFTQMQEMTAPAAPAADRVRIYAEDNGAGKTRLMALFATGAAVQIAIEP